MNYGHWIMAYDLTTSLFYQKSILGNKQKHFKTNSSYHDLIVL